MRRLLLFLALASCSFGQGVGGRLSTSTGHTITNAVFCSATSGSSTAYTCNTSPSFTPVDGDLVDFDVDVTNSGAITLSVNGAPAVAVKKWTTGASSPTALASGDLQANQPVWVYFDSGLNIWSLMSPVANTSTVTNVLPSVVSSQATSGGNVSTLAIVPPGAIVNGNALWIYIVAKGVTTETWTPAAGWTQVGSTLTSVVTSQVVTAKFCKVAASESGNYTFSWNNSTTGGVQAFALQVAGAGCTPDNSGSATGKASTLSVSPFAITSTQELLLIFNGQANNTTLFINNPFTATQINTSSANGIGVFSLPWVAGNTPTVSSLNYAGGPFSDDTTLEVVALAPTVTTTTPTTCMNSTTQGCTTQNLRVSGGGDFAGPVSAQTFILSSCDSGSSVTRTINTFAVKRNDGTLVPVISVQCSNGSLLIDPGGNAGNINLGNGGTTGGGNLLINSGFVDFITRDAAAGSQDVNVMSLSLAVAGDSLNATGNNLIFGCLIDPCTGGTILGDIIIRAQTAKAVRIASGVQDELWVNGSGFVGGVPVAAMATPAAPTVAATCTGTCVSTWSYAVDCLDANGNTTPVSANGSTAVNATTLDGTHKNTVTWTKTIGCKTYELRRTVVATSPATTGIITTIASGLALSFVDSGTAGDSSTAPTVNTTGRVVPVSYGTATNCSNSASPAACGSAAAGSFVIAAAGTAVTVNTTAITAHSHIFVQEDESLGTELGVTCNTGILANPPAITARSTGVSFAVGITAGLAVNPVCFSYWIVD